MSAYGCIQSVLWLPCKLCSTVFRVKALPLVCRRWHKIMSDVSMWPCVNVEARGKVQHVSSLSTWLRQRSPGIRELTLRVSIQCGCTC